MNLDLSHLRLNLQYFRLKLGFIFEKAICRNSNGVDKIKGSIKNMKIQFPFKKQLIDFTSTDITNEHQMLYIH